MISILLNNIINWRAITRLSYAPLVLLVYLVISPELFGQIHSRPEAKRIPGNIPAVEVQKSEPDSSSKESAVLKRNQAMDLRYFVDYYHESGDIMHHVLASYRRDWDRLSVELRGIWADRLGFQGQNYGVGIFPQITASTYLELEGTYSIDSIYPEWSASGTLVQGIGSWLELSGGYQYVQFPAQTVELYTGSIGLYPGNWEIMAWGFYTEQMEHYDYSGSGRIRYLGDNKTSYIGVQAGYGPISEGLYFARDRIRTEHLYGALIWSIRLNPSWDLVGRGSYHQEKFYPAEVLRERFRGELGFLIKF